MRGTGVPQDDTEAARLYQLAADQGCGHADALVHLARMYENGTGVPQDDTEAQPRLAADQGQSSGQCNLVVMYYKRTVIPKDLTEAARLFKLADDQGFQLARDILG